MDELVQSVVCYNPRPLLFHGYLAPFFVLQAAVYYYFAAGISGGSADIDGNDVSITDSSNSTTATPGSNETSNSPAIIASTFANTTREVSDRHSYEIAVIAVAVSVAAQVIAYLFCHWSVEVKCWLSYNRCSDQYKSQYAKVTPTPNNGATELVPLRKEVISNQNVLWFIFQKAKYVFVEKEQKFVAVEFPCDREISYYKQWKGYGDAAEVQSISRQYGKNELEMVVPEFKELFIERATAPFFVFQTFCVGLWCLDEFWYYALFTLFMLVTFEMMLVKQQLRNMQEVRRMGNQPYMVQVYRQRKWISLRSDGLISGDLVSIVRSEQSIPCDILLVRGSCIIDESTLTGESAPQMKEPIEDIDDTENRTLDINQDKLHILFGGTKVLQHTAPAKEPGCIGYVLRTGFHTSQGKLLRTILFGVKRVTANNFETFCFIMFLLFFAMLSAYYVWTKGIEDPERSRYRLMFECVVIITSVVPPELPIELSLAVNTSLLALSKLCIYCTEPFRIPFAGKVEYLCFDKTGTLTSDDLIIEGVAGLPKTDGSPEKSPSDSNEGTANTASTVSSDDQQTVANGSKPTGTATNQIRSSMVACRVAPISNCPNYTQQVLASCHSLTHLDEKLVGVPLEKKVLEAINWSYSKSGTVVPKKGRVAPLKIHQRFHFNSTLKRMSVIASYKMDMSNENVYICTAKGAPEFMRPLFKEVPSDYDQIYLTLSQMGLRILALGFKTLGPQSHDELAKVTRESAEVGLMFAGFLLISCPLKPDSKGVSEELLLSGHRLVMITGDGALTACHVASMLGFITKKVLILTKVDPAAKKKVRFECFNWVSTDQTIAIPFGDCIEKSREFFKKYDLCLTGESLDFVSKEQKEATSYEILRRVKVFARVSPKQKELVITTLKSRGKSVLMCGDGTNDVGALKHADVGVALFASSGPIQQKPLSRPPQQELPGNVKSNVEQTMAQRHHMAAAPNRNAPLANRTGANNPGRRSAAGGGGNQAMTAEERRRAQVLETQARLQEFLDEQDRAQLVRLGDASIAAPFTSRLSSIRCISHIIKQGRCTLVTTLQMFKILALNALLSAYCHSVLYLDGIKFSDAQATTQGLLATFCFLFITRSKPLTKLSSLRPLPNIFNAYTISTVTLQFAVHFSSLAFLYSQSKIFQESMEKQANATTISTGDSDALNSSSSSTGTILATNETSGSSETGSKDNLLHTEFKPSIVNSTVYIIWMSVQLVTFVVNYKGHPFMQDLFNNRPLCYSFIGSAFVVFACVNNWSPSLTELLSIVELPSDFRHIVLGIILGNFLMCLVIDRICEYLFGRLKLEPI